MKGHTTPKPAACKAKAPALAKTGMPKAVETTKINISKHITWSDVKKFKLNRNSWTSRAYQRVGAQCRKRGMNVADVKIWQKKAYQVAAEMWDSKVSV